MVVPALEQYEEQRAMFLESKNRQSGITGPQGSFTYAYNTGLGGTASDSALISKLVLPNGAWISNTYDNNGRMLGTWLTNSSSNIDSSVYTYNVGNQRTTLTRTAENEAAYTYDAISEVISDTATEVPSGTNRDNEQLHYAFDPAGNLQYRTNNALVENFQVNTLNELTKNTNGGKLTVMGTATSSNATTVTVNGTNALVYGDAAFAATNMPLTTSYTAIAADSYGRHSTNTVNVSLSTNNTGYQYDGNGNLTNDGLRSFAYDDESQLIQVWVSNQWLSQFTYDGKMRRRIRQEFTWQGGGWVQTNEVYYVYDGNEVIQERNINNLPTTTYTRGRDLSGSLEGAGGIGGLLSMTLNTALGPSSSNTYYYHSDGNGNVTMLINPSQYIVAKYLYDAFGNVLAASGSIAQQNLYRFSSKEVHVNSGLLYYLYRYYDPNLQRWPNRDPIQEEGGINLYGFVNNEPTIGIDGLGLIDIPEPDPPPGPNSPGCAAAKKAAAAAFKAWAAAPPGPVKDAALAALTAAIAAETAACTTPPSSPNSPKCVPRPPPLPPNSNNNTWQPPNLWPWVLRIAPWFLIPWPGNPVYGGA